MPGSTAGGALSVYGRVHFPAPALDMPRGAIVLPKRIR
jgi:hypothetical protein